MNIGQFFPYLCLIVAGILGVQTQTRPAIRSTRIRPKSTVSRLIRTANLFLLLDQRTKLARLFGVYLSRCFSALEQHKLGWLPAFEFQSMARKYWHVYSKSKRTCSLNCLSAITGTGKYGRIGFDDGGLQFKS